MSKLPLFLALLVLLASVAFAKKPTERGYVKKDRVLSESSECSNFEYRVNDGLYKNGVKTDEIDKAFNSCKFPPKGQSGKLKPRDKKKDKK